MKKKLYFKLSDNADMSNVVMSLEDIKYHIECDMEGQGDLSNDIEYTLSPIYLTDEEYNDLEEAII